MKNTLKYWIVFLVFCVSASSAFAYGDLVKLASPQVNDGLANYENLVELCAVNVRADHDEVTVKGGDIYLFGTFSCVQYLYLVTDENIYAKSTPDTREKIIAMYQVMDDGKLKELWMKPDVLFEGEEATYKVYGYVSGDLYQHQGEWIQCTILGLHTDGGNGDVYQNGPTYTLTDNYCGTVWISSLGEKTTATFGKDGYAYLGSYYLDSEGNQSLTVSQFSFNLVSDNPKLLKSVRQVEIRENSGKKIASIQPFMDESCRTAALPFNATIELPKNEIVHVWAKVVGTKHPGYISAQLDARNVLATNKNKGVRVMVNHPMWSHVTTPSVLFK